MSSELRTCHRCQRHIRVKDAACPFCGAASTWGPQSKSPPPAVPGHLRLKRSAALAFAAAAMLTAHCGDDTASETGDQRSGQAGGTAGSGGSAGASGVGAGGSPAYGAPPMGMGGTGGDAGSAGDAGAGGDAGSGGQSGSAGDGGQGGSAGEAGQGGGSAGAAGVAPPYGTPPGGMGGSENLAQMGEWTGARHLPHLQRTGAWHLSHTSLRQPQAVDDAPSLPN